MIRLCLTMLLLQSLPLPPRTDLENPVPSPVARAAKDYDKLWSAFLSGKDDMQALLDADKLMTKERTLDPVINTVKAYINLYRGDKAAAERYLETVLAGDSQNRIALRYLGDLAFAREDYARASAWYSRLLLLGDGDSFRSEIAPKRQKAVLMAAENRLRLAAQAEKEGRIGEAEQFYREAGGRPVVAEVAAPAPPTPAAGVEADRRLAELEDLGRWGADIRRFRKMEVSNALTREEFAVLVMRYFPELVEYRQTPKPAADIRDSWAVAEIQILLGLGIADLRVDEAFHPTETLTRGDLCRSLSQLAHVVGAFSWEVGPNTLPDVASDDPLLRDVQWALGSGLLVPDKSGEFRPQGEVSGREAVNAVDRLVSETRKKGINTPSFQQQP